MSETEPRPPARVVAQEDLPQPPPTRPRRAAILVQTIGDVAAREHDPDEDIAFRPAIVRVIGGANGDDGEAISAIGGIRIIGSAADDDTPAGGR
ncbi:MAG TPA: hypothetical protein VE547_05455 [Mycobacteriales bacterium]|nr:hypothetical protein [Mycobacteriales bacterium]